MFVYSWIRTLCFCSKETKRSPRKGLDFHHATKTSQELPIPKAGVTGQVTEQGEEAGHGERRVNVLFLWQFLSNHTIAKWKVLVCFKKSWDIFFLCKEFWNLKSMILWLHWPRQLNSTQHIPMKMNHSILIAVYSFYASLHITVLSANPL